MSKKKAIKNSIYTKHKHSYNSINKARFSTWKMFCFLKDNEQDVGYTDT